MKEEKIIEGLKVQDRKALEAFNKKYKRFMVSAASKVTKNLMIAEDVYQECFLKVLRGIKDFNPENSFKGWLWTIAYRTAIIHYHREKRFVFSDIDGYEPMQVRVDDCFAALASRDTYVKAMRRLQEDAPSMYMHVRLHFEEQMTYEEVAKDIDMLPGSVKSQVSRGAAKMREYVKELEQVELKKIA